MQPRGQQFDIAGVSSGAPAAGRYRVVLGCDATMWAALTIHAEMISWWMNVHGLPFQGQIIHWKSGQPATDTAVAGAASNPNLPRGEV